MGRDELIARLQAVLDSTAGEHGVPQRILAADAVAVADQLEAVITGEDAQAWLAIVRGNH